MIKTRGCCSCLLTLIDPHWLCDLKRVPISLNSVSGLCSEDGSTYRPLVRISALVGPQLLLALLLRRLERGSHCNHTNQTSDTREAKGTTFVKAVLEKCQTYTKVE